VYHRYAHSIPARGFRLTLAALVRRLRADLARARAARRLSSLAHHDTYLGPDGHPYERLCPWG
jgi:hypothetical protein